MGYAHHVSMTGRRSYKRIKCMIPVDYVVNSKVYRNFIHDISSKGAFINCKDSPRTGENIVMTFSWKKPVKSNGIVIRVDPDGFAVQFSQPLST